MNNSSNLKNACIEEVLTQRSFMPSTHQRRLWQRERQLQIDIDDLNSMFARYYSDHVRISERAAGRQKLKLMRRIRPTATTYRLRNAVLKMAVQAQRSQLFQNFFLRTAALVMRVMKNKWKI
ncbi:hypothetical protein DASB73_001500 [Starmerella bacillaris]|uniref:Uncharacterized protein n=1 Tax=Starmerella bacillaris TaxID=1247836 RepID=A0AAV5RDZ4_STABA|nr:hypothetical protein DASB73_001500 [Starmerella bacillaris]